MMINKMKFKLSSQSMLVICVVAIALAAGIYSVAWAKPVQPKEATAVTKQANAKLY